MRKNWLTKLAGKQIFLLIGLLNVFCLNAVGQFDKEFSRALQVIGDEAGVSSLCINLSNNDTLWDYHSKQSLVPASVLKLVTTATALELLGPDYQYHTTFCYSGSIVDSVLKGNLIVVGGGDPTFGSSLFKDASPEIICSKVASSLKKKGVKSIEGNIQIVDNFFGHSGLPSARLWEDIGNYYGAAPSALTYRDNTLAIYLSSPSTVGSMCKVVETVPALKDINFECHVYASANKSDSAYVYGVAGLKDWRIQGAIPVSQSRFLVKAALSNPAFVFGSDLKQFLVKAGLQLNGSVEVLKDEFQFSVNKLITIDSPPLRDIITTINVYSNNLFADHLFLTVGKGLKSNSAWDAGGLAVRDFWKSRISTRESLFFYDGSGLSPNNCISASSLVSVLKAESKSRYFNDYYSSLAIGGERGTLRHLWKTDDVKGRIHAKSGSMKGVVAYAGYFYNNNNELCAFSVIVNHSVFPSKTVRGAIERLIGFAVCN